MVSLALLPACRVQPCAVRLAAERVRQPRIFVTKHVDALRKAAPDTGAKSCVPGQPGPCASCAAPAAAAVVATTPRQKQSVIAGPPPPASRLPWDDDLRVCVLLGALDAALRSVGYKRTTNTGVRIESLVFELESWPPEPPPSVTVEVGGPRVPVPCRFCDQAVGNCAHCAHLSHVRMGDDDEVEADEDD